MFSGQGMTFLILFQAALLWLECGRYMSESKPGGGETTQEAPAIIQARDSGQTRMMAAVAMKGDRVRVTPELRSRGFGNRNKNEG